MKAWCAAAVTIAVAGCAWSFAAPAASVRVVSCDGRYQLRQDDAGHVLLQAPGGKRTLLSPGHGLVGGAIDVAHRQFVIYGVPATVDRQAPQAMAISVYAGLDRPRRLMRESTGAGIYRVGYGADGRSIVVEYGYGAFVIDLARRRIGTLLPPGQVPPAVVDCAAGSSAGQS